MIPEDAPGAVDTAGIDHRQQGLQLYQEQSYEAAGRSFALAAENTTGDDYATLKLHEALCYLQAEQYDTVIDRCTALLDADVYSTAIRARAYYRRAKAYHLSDDAHHNTTTTNTERVLADARRAAFLGDKKAVAFYGQLMRSSAGGSEAMEASSAAAMGSHPFLAAPSNRPNVNPLSSFFAPSPNGPPNTGLVQSVLKSLLKRIDDRATQEQICRYLQTQTSAAQLQQYGALVGLNGIPTPYWERLVQFCHGMSLPRLRRLVFCTKSVAVAVQVGRRLLRLGAKYRTLLTACVLYGWIQSALRRPLPVSKRRRNALRAATVLQS
jgi:hypothetical protein